MTITLLGLGDRKPASNLGEDTLRRCRRALGPDHAVALGAAAILTHALLDSVEVEPARALGEDTLQRSRRVLGPDHPMTLYLTQAVSIGRIRTTSANGAALQPGRTPSEEP